MEVGAAVAEVGVAVDVVQVGRGNEIVAAGALGLVLREKLCEEAAVGVPGRSTVGRGTRLSPSHLHALPRCSRTDREGGV